MKISEKYGEEKTTESLRIIINNKKDNLDVFQKMKNNCEALPCSQCGYTDCVCTPNRYSP